MGSTLIQKLHEEFKKQGAHTIPQEFVPPDNGYILTKWVHELFIHYKEQGIVDRSLDELPPIKLSMQAGLSLTLQNIHKFIISDLNLIPLEGKKNIIENATGHESSAAAWQAIIPLLLSQLQGLNRETVQEELSWKFSPVGEMLWVITWFFMEREAINPPAKIILVCDRFPYYLWVTEQQKEGSVQQSFWQPDNPLCRWEWLAMDLLLHWLQTNQV
jgi:hypothetical protein